MKIILGVLGIFLCLTHFSQYSISGKIIDAKTGELLPFVNIGVNNTNLGTSTDID
jgi:Rieske Fe-S protein